jgi:putative tricarboxylic transport membrane protein
MDRRGDLAMAIVVSLYGVLLIIATSQQNSGPTFDPIGKQGLPYFLGAFILVGGVFLTARRLLTWRAEPSNIVYEEGAEDEPGHPASLIRAGAVVLFTVGYALALPYAGFLLATPVYIFAGLWVMDFRSRIAVLITPIAFTVVIFAVFSQVLSVPLPVGPLRDVLVDLGWINAIR